MNAHAPGHSPLAPAAGTTLPPGARLVVAPGAGHMLPLERDALVSGELVELVADAQASARARAASPDAAGTAVRPAPM